MNSADAMNRILNRAMFCADQLDARGFTQPNADRELIAILEALDPPEPANEVCDALTGFVEKNPLLAVQYELGVFCPDWSVNPDRFAAALRLFVQRRRLIILRGETLGDIDFSDRE